MAVPDMGGFNEIGAKRTITGCFHSINYNWIVVEDIFYPIETRQYVAQLYDTHRTVRLLVNRRVVSTEC